MNLALAYLSKSTTDFDHGTIEDLVSKAASYNKQTGITGFLIYDQGRFFQYLEGAPENTRNLYHKIQQDTRHEILIDAAQNIAKPRFNSWSMRHISTAEALSVCTERDIMNLLARSSHNELSIPDWKVLLWKLLDDLHERLGDS